AAPVERGQRFLRLGDVVEEAVPAGADDAGVGADVAAGVAQGLVDLLVLLELVEQLVEAGAGGADLLLERCELAPAEVEERLVVLELGLGAGPGQVVEQLVGAVAQVGEEVVEL